MGKRRQREKYSRDGVTLGRRGRDAHAELYDPKTGKRSSRVRLTRNGQPIDIFKEPEAAKEALDKFVQARQTIAVAKSSLTIGDLWLKWLADRERDGYNNNRENAAWVSLGPKFKNTIPQNLTADQCRDYAQQRFDLGRSQWTVHTELNKLRRCMNWSAERNHINKAPYVWVPSRGQPRNRVLTYDEARTLLMSAGAPHVFLFIVLLLTTGARHRAICGLTWDRIDFENGLIEYDEQEVVNPMHKSYRKGRATVPMNAMSRLALENAYQGRETDHVIEWHSRPCDNLKKGFKAAVERGGLDPAITPHVIRHTVGTWAEQKTSDSRRIADLLGHKDPRTSEMIYIHADPKRLSDVVTHFDDLVGALPQRTEKPRKSSGRSRENAEELSTVDKKKSRPGVTRGGE